MSTQQSKISLYIRASRIDNTDHINRYDIDFNSTHEHFTEHLTHTLHHICCGALASLPTAPGQTSLHGPPVVFLLHPISMAFIVQLVNAEKRSAQQNRSN